MNHSKSVSVQVGTRTLKLETGTLAQQAAGAVMATIGETMVFSAVTNTAKPREGIDFFPLQVEYREKFYAAGKFPGGFFKREARPSEREILIMRVTDRPIRPLFPAGYRNDVQINNALVSFDGVNMPGPFSAIFTPLGGGTSVIQSASLCFPLCSTFQVGLPALAPGTYTVSLRMEAFAPPIVGAFGSVTIQ